MSTEVTPSSGTSDPEQPLQQVLNVSGLRRQNRAYRGTGGVSANNRNSRFVPAYQNTRSGLAVVSCFADGSPAPVHLLEGLPEAWVVGRDTAGQVSTVHPDVIAGFIRDGLFYTREAAALLVQQEYSGANT